MSQRIILPSTSDDRVYTPSDGYEYTIGPKQSLPNEASSALIPSRIYSESLVFRKQEVSLSAMAFLFQEMVAMIHKSSGTAKEFEIKLNGYGYGIGTRLVELLNFRNSMPPNYSKSSTFLSNPANVSNNEASSTGGTGTGTSSTVSDHTYYHHENGNESLAAIINNMRPRDLKILDILQFIHGSMWSYLFGHVSDDLVKSSERDNEYMIVDNLPMLTQFIPAGRSCDYFTCGIIQGFLNSAEFPCHVSAHSMPQDGYDQRTVYLIQFDKHVLERDSLRFGP
ncbi:TRS31 (YDR472W) [Zygosaccharomyces parabailii]|uniref:Trafficking protein particle complex subunit n=1 Tax=Zygosaccharomyces bailii (strain CLIB 213 / ATCC 58445 / CBS 680 / BCRC 21525 / NBRC 1098 / NCYC 1416 / NRRL Y-2227) TaxID=1333698 RepID=A0A8J2WUU2_ZYGB2|nr:TRS31 (YDR472W) [Zygosaccharomyces parabailii]CDF87567.1 BN860_09384g1_1 [Zygosaccharomyces bailii CLIB 213]CDH15379.1 probable Trafficking protein particle complex subunit 31 [Zygosaccharomyces bailii ISA1307]SJM87774.1 probable Trafficking protein particle complex subunit 31 [Zygosaccharomyces bailii]